MDENINGGTTAPLPEPIQPSGPETVLPGPGVTYAAPAAPAAPVYVQVPVAPADAVPPHAAHRPATWIIVTAATVAAVLLLAITFGVGVAVGSHASRFERGPVGMMRPPGAWGGQNGERGWRNDGDAPQGPGNGRGYDYHGFGGRGGPGGRMYQNAPDPQTTPQQ